MTIIPPSLHEPIRRFKRYFGLFALTEGVLVLLGTLVWIALYFAERGMAIDSLRSTIIDEFFYWSPILIFDVPGLLLVFHGKRMMDNEPISLFEFVTTLGLVVATIAVAFLAQPSVS